MKKLKKKRRFLVQNKQAERYIKNYKTFFFSMQYNIKVKRDHLERR
jgi:hypothetical protein